MTRDARSPAPNHEIAQPGDPAAILASIGLVPYDWRIDTDTLIWGANAAEVLQVSDAERLATGRGYAGLLDPKNTSDALRCGDAGDRARRRRRRSVPDRILRARRPQPARRGSGSKTTGAGSPGADGRPARAHGVVRVVNERHDHQQRLSYLSRFDNLTGEMNRNALTEALDHGVRRGDRSFAALAASC